MNTDEKRRIVESLVKSIRIGKDEIDISLCYLPSFREMTNRHRTLRIKSPNKDKFCREGHRPRSARHGHFSVFQRLSQDLQSGTLESGSSSRKRTPL